MSTQSKSKRGFAGMSPERRREIASMGGKAVAPESRSFSRDASLAAAAGHKGGKSVPPAKRTFSVNNDMAVDAGRKGGLSKRNRADV